MPTAVAVNGGANGHTGAKAKSRGALKRMKAKAKRAASETPSEAKSEVVESDNEVCHGLDGADCSLLPLL